MKAHVITMLNDEYSVKCADRCIKSAKKYLHIPIKKFNAVTLVNVDEIYNYMGIKWNWACNNKQKCVNKKTGLLEFPYRTDNIKKKIACSLSHYFLWDMCVRRDEEFLILEHDAIFINKFPESIEYKGICQINDPEGATYKGKWWSEYMRKRGLKGVHEKTWVRPENERNIPDGLAGNSAYLIKPWAAKELINKMRDIGMQPNDALMCKQLFPYLEEYYPFITKVNQERSTTV